MTFAGFVGFLWPKHVNDKQDKQIKNATAKTFVLPVTGSVGEKNKQTTTSKQNKNRSNNEKLCSWEQQHCVDSSPSHTHTQKTPLTPPPATPHHCDPRSVTALLSNSSSYVAGKVEHIVPPTTYRRVQPLLWNRSSDTGGTSIRTTKLSTNTSKLECWSQYKSVVVPKRPTRQSRNNDATIFFSLASLLSYVPCGTSPSFPPKQGTNLD